MWETWVNFTTVFGSTIKQYFWCEYPRILGVSKKKFYIVRWCNFEYSLIFKRENRHLTVYILFYSAKPWQLYMYIILLFRSFVFILNITFIWSYVTVNIYIPRDATLLVDSFLVVIKACPSCFLFMIKEMKLLILPIYTCLILILNSTVCRGLSAVFA